MKISKRSKMAKKARHPYYGYIAPHFTNKLYCRACVSFATGSGRAVFANSEQSLEMIGPAEDMKGGSDDFANETPPAEQELKLCEYGDHPHSGGLQRVTKKSAEKMSRDFANLLQRLKRKFAGAPIYIGHPDDPGFAGRAGHTDTRAYGWVNAVRAGTDGIYVKVKWSEPGQELLSNAHYKFLSPRWLMESVARRVYSPIRLVSIGLTNQPNIPGEALANAKTTDNTMEILNKILMKLGFTAEQATALVEGAESAPSEDDVMAALDGAIQARTEAANAKQELQSVTKERDAVKANAQIHEKALSNERQARITAEVDKAILEGRATFATRSDEIAAISNAQDVDAAIQLLKSRTPKLHTQSNTRDIGRRQADAQTASNERAALVAKHQANGLDYDKAWSRAKRENPELFKTLQS